MKKFLGFSVLVSKLITLFCLSISFFEIPLSYAQEKIPCHQEVQSQEEAECEICIESKNSWEVQATICDFSQEKIVKKVIFVFQNFLELDSVVFSTDFFIRPPPKIFKTAEYTLRKQIIVLRV